VKLGYWQNILWVEFLYSWQQKQKMKFEYQEELKKAIQFFEKSLNEPTFFKPALFHNPFSRSIYSITFDDQEFEIEINKQIEKAKKAIEIIRVEVQDSKEYAEELESDILLLDIVENLEKALREAHKSKELGFKAMISDYKTYEQYFNQAAKLLYQTQKTAPVASRVIKRGLPIIDQRIKKIIKHIQEKARSNS